MLTSQALEERNLNLRPGLVQFVRHVLVLWHWRRLGIKALHQKPLSRWDYGGCGPKRCTVRKHEKTWKTHQRWHYVIFFSGSICDSWWPHLRPHYVDLCCITFLLHTVCASSLLSDLEASCQRQGIQICCSVQHDQPRQQSLPISPCGRHVAAAAFRWAEEKWVVCSGLNGNCLIRCTLHWRRIIQSGECKKNA